MIDIGALTDVELDSFTAQAKVEADRRAKVKATRATLDRALTDYATAIGGNVVEAWRKVAPEGWDAPEPEARDFVQPSMPSETYRRGDRVVFEGKTYVSLIDSNWYSPSVPGTGAWRLI